MRGWRSLRWKLALPIVATVGLSVGLAFWLSFHGVSESLARESDQRMTVVAGDRSEMVDTFIDYQAEGLRVVASYAPLREVLSEERARRLESTPFLRRSYEVLTDAKGGAPDFLHICLVDNEGRIRTSTRQPWIGHTVREVLGVEPPSEFMHLGEPFEWNKRRVALIAGAVQGADGGQLPGSLLALVDVERVLTSVESTKNLGASPSVVLGRMRDGAFQPFAVSSARSSFDEQPQWSAIPVPQPTPTGEPRIVEGALGGRFDVVFHPIGERDWTLLIALDCEQRHALASGMREQLLVLLVLILGLAGVVAMYLAQRFAQPVVELAGAAQAVAEGNLRVRLDVRRSDEIGRLTESFNRMTSELARSYETLDRRVHERTVELQEANSELSSFSHSVAHDLRAPLRAIAGYAKVLEEDKAPQLDPQARELIDRMSHNAHRVGQLIDDLLAFSGIGRRELSIQTVDARAIVRDVLEDFRPETQGRRIDIEVRALPACRADEALLSLVFSNLLSNAIKYTRPREHARVVVGSELRNGEQVFFVRDNGVGFDMAYAGLLFGIFQRLHTRTEFEGTGVGLAIARRVVERHGGRIWAESAPDQGATFFFTLAPARRAPQDGSTDGSSSSRDTAAA